MMMIYFEHMHCMKQLQHSLNTIKTGVFPVVHRTSFMRHLMAVAQRKSLLHFRCNTLCQTKKLEKIEQPRIHSKSCSKGTPQSTGKLKFMSENPLQQEYKASSYLRNPQKTGNRAQWANCLMEKLFIYSDCRIIYLEWDEYSAKCS